MKRTLGLTAFLFGLSFVGLTAAFAGQFPSDRVPECSPEQLRRSGYLDVKRFPFIQVAKVRYLVPVIQKVVSDSQKASGASDDSPQVIRRGWGVIAGDDCKAYFYSADGKRHEKRMDFADLKPSCSLENSMLRLVSVIQQANFEMTGWKASADLDSIQARIEAMNHSWQIMEEKPVCSSLNRAREKVCPLDCVETLESFSKSYACHGGAQFALGDQDKCALCCK